MYYIYRHVRLDTQQPFYIGMSTCAKEAKTFNQEHARAFQCANRSDMWKSIYAKTKRRVDIMFYSDDKDIIMNKEIELIALYGRRDLGLGSLVNFTDGGETGVSSLNSEDRAKWLENCKRVAVYQYGSDGKFIAKYNTITDACLKYSNAKSVCAMKKACADSCKTLYGYKWYYEDQGNLITPFTTYKDRISISLTAYKGDIEIGQYTSIKEAARELKLKPSLIRRVLNGTASHTQGYIFGV